MDHFECCNGINEVILRGIQLREEKNRLCPVPREYDLDFALNEPTCSRTAPWHNFESGREMDISRKYRLPSNFKNTQKNTCVKKKRQQKRFRQTKARCPMRVAELSVPTKRHCLETWRTNRDVLPSFMVERLRQIIMDEKPIVKIYDAIDCFRRQKAIKARSSKGRVKPKNQDKIKLFSALLSYKIIQKLLRPLNLTLNLQLKNLSRVVDDEITSILNNSEKCKLIVNNKIQTEIANKITVWIANVLEESAYKLLLEDFQELREEEGPVWDLLDELIDNVVIMCEPMNIVSSSVTDLSIPSISKTITNEKHNFILDEASENQYDENSSNSNQTQEIQKNNSIIAYILDNINYNEKASSPSKNSVNETDYDIKVDSFNINENSDGSVTSSKGSLNNEHESREYLNRSEASFSQEKSLNKIDSKQSNLHETNDYSTNLDDDDKAKQQNLTYVEDMVKIKDTDKEREHLIHMHNEDKNIESTGNQIEVQHEDTPDDSIKKVKFSNLNIGINIRKTSVNNDSNSLFVREGHDDMAIKFSKDESIKSELQFAPPNDHLLSAADESWPENLQFPVLKATVSVSKSVLSLGKILESEEKQLISLEKDIISNDDKQGSFIQSIRVDINDEKEKNKNVTISENDKNSQKNYKNNDKQYAQENNATNFITPFVDVTRKEILTNRETAKKKTINMIIEHIPVINIKPKGNNKDTCEEAIQTEQEVLKNVYRK